MRKVRIAQIGTSAMSHGSSIWESLKKQSDLFEVVGYALPENEREKFPEKMAGFDGFREMTVEEILTDNTIEAVAIETEEIYLTNYALMAARAGKHIHMEKPGGIGAAEFDRLIDTVKANGTVFHTGYMYRYNPAVIELLRRIDRGELGDIVCVEAQMSCLHTDAAREWLATFPGGMMFFLGCHLTDLVFRIMGKPTSVVPFNHSVTGGTACDYGMAVLEYPSGASFIKTSAAEIGGFCRRQLVVTGTACTAEIRPLEAFGDEGFHYTEVVYTSGRDWAARGEVERTEQYDRYDPMMASFAAMVRGEKENPYSYEYERELHKLVLQCCGG